MSGSHFTPIFQDTAALGPFEFAKLHDEGGTLVVSLLDGRNGSVELRCDSYVAYRKRDEGDCLALLNDLAGSGLLGRWFYQVEGSDFLVWFHRESYDVRTEEGVRHYLITASNDVIEVLALDPPTVTSAYQPS